MFIPGKAPVLNVSYKPQKISPKSVGSVRQMLHDKIRDAYIHPQFVTDVIKPLQIEQLFDQEVQCHNRELLLEWMVLATTKSTKNLHILTNLTHD